MFCFGVRDLVVIGTCLGLAIITIQQWKQYDACYAPTQIFIIETLGLILSHRILDEFKRKPFVPVFLRRLFILMLNLIISPAFFYVTVQGVIWQVMNDTHAPKCLPLRGTSWMVWTALSFLVIFDAVIIFYAVSYIVVWKKFRDFRRRQANNLSETQILGEYINGRLTQVFLNGTLNNDNDGPLGLSYEELLRLPKSIYNNGADSSRQIERDSCPVCFEDFKDGDEICSLPTCTHIFHWKCIYGWFVISSLCPMCRTNVKHGLQCNTSMNNSAVGTVSTSSINAFDIESQSARAGGN